MKFLKEFIKDKDLKLTGNNITREAVKGIIFRKNKILLIHSRVNNDYKFPGGGIEKNETHIDTNKRFYLFGKMILNGSLLVIIIGKLFQIM